MAAVARPGWGGGALAIVAVAGEGKMKVAPRAS